MINKFILKNSIYVIPFLAITIHTLKWCNKPVEKEMKMPILFDIREQAKKAYKFACEGAHQIGIVRMPDTIPKHNY